MNTNKGITLVSLVITIIIMLILAGVSLSMVTGDSSVLGQAKKTAFLQKMAGYKEELAISLLDEATKSLRVVDKTELTARGASVKDYIPSIADEDINKFAVLQGELYYVGDDAFEISVCKEQGFVTIPEGMSLEEFENQIESGALEAVLKQLGGKPFKETTESGTTYKGTRLKNKNSGIGFGWKIIADIQNGVTKATYGTGWWYVTKGTELNKVGVLKNDYIINYDDKKVVKFDPTRHALLSGESDLAVTTDIVYYFDPSITDVYNSTGSITWDSKYKVHGYNADYSDAFSDKGMKFDGRDDYMEVAGNTGKITNNGFTFEFYGKVTSPNRIVNGVWKEASGQAGILGLAKNTNVKYNIKFYFLGNKVNANEAQRFVGLNYGMGSTINPWTNNKYKDYISTSAEDTWNQCIDLSKYGGAVQSGTDTYFSVVIDPVKDKQSIYVNGEFKDEVQLNTAAWKDLKNQLKNDNTGNWYIGRSSQNTNETWFAMTGEVYAARVYERPLTKDEIKANYIQTMGYFNILVDDENSGTSGDTGGSDFGSIETE